MILFFSVSHWMNKMVLCRRLPACKSAYCTSYRICIPFGLKLLVCLYCFIFCYCLCILLFPVMTRSVPFYPLCTDTLSGLVWLSADIKLGNKSPQICSKFLDLSSSTPLPTAVTSINGSKINKCNIVTVHSN